MKAIAGFSAALLAMLLAGCGAPQEPMHHTPPPPAGAASYSGTASTTAAQLAMSDLHERLARHYSGEWEVSRYSLDEGTSWADVRAHYASALGADWNPDTRFPEQATGYRCAVWTAGSRAVAIAMQPPSPPDRHPVLTVFVPDA